ncbi:MAG TPA: NAD(P)H-dependent oxidoreductase [Thermomicrobiales bacterium]|nr:NAD(P)H-dependent oxidoreductase [Thermomicrobiales bacterium]
MSDNITPADNGGARLRIAIIVGSNRSGRFGETISNWFVAQAKQIEGIDFDVIDLASLDIPMDFSGGGDSADFRSRIGAADGFIVITPEYNHSFPGYLKHAIDSVKDEWKTKPVGFVSYGGVSGGLRAVEGLRLVFAELHATTIRDAVSFHQAHGLFDENGQLTNPDGPNATAAYVINELAWWAEGLKTARATVKYPA